MPKQPRIYPTLQPCALTVRRNLIRYPIAVTLSDDRMHVDPAMAPLLSNPCAVTLHCCTGRLLPMIYTPGTCCRSGHRRVRAALHPSGMTQMRPQRVFSASVMRVKDGSQA